ncbi:hypothetical protein Bbelb_230490 [Branchiostoma belcheri]|nr:hypothetical protein Bbelb_230490 [Branchiostoma belcheri]
MAAGCVTEHDPVEFGRVDVKPETSLCAKCGGFFNVRGVWLSPNTGPPFNVLSGGRPWSKLGQMIGGIGQDSNPRPLESGPKTLPLCHTTPPTDISYKLQSSL